MSIKPDVYIGNHISIHSYMLTCLNKHSVTWWSGLMSSCINPILHGLLLQPVVQGGKGPICSICNFSSRACRTNIYGWRWWSDPL